MPDFPKPIWGAATSAHQVEGGNEWNDWWAWEKAGKVNERSGAACGHYRLFREDFRLARSLGHTAHRFSLEWSRLEPKEGEWNEAAFGHYDEVLDALKDEGLEPVVTLHHFTNPSWFLDQGGWLQAEADQKFSRFVKQVALRYGKKVRYWITLNEPLIYIYQGFITGKWPPGEKSYSKAIQVVRQFIQAHVEAYQVLHQYSGSECWVSVAHHMTAFIPCRPCSLLDRLAVYLRNQFVNQLLFQSLIRGFLFYPGVFWQRLKAKKTLDFLGVNYYTRDFIRFSGLTGENGFGEVCSKDHHGGQIQELNDLGWEVYPPGIYEVANSLKRFNLPILITENGVCTSDDNQRQRFIQTHLEQLKRARQEKIPIFGYFYWSLVDNFEWADGFSPRFGLIEVDYKTQTRRLRPSAQVLKTECGKIFKD